MCLCQTNVYFTISFLLSPFASRMHFKRLSNDPRPDQCNKQFNFFFDHSYPTIYPTTVKLGYDE